VFSVGVQFRDAIDYAFEAATFFEPISISAANVTVSELYERLRDLEILIRSDLNDEIATHERIDPIAAIEQDIFVTNGQRHLHLKDPTQALARAVSPRVRQVSPSPDWGFNSIANLRVFPFDRG